MHINDQASDLWWNLLEYLIGVDNAILQIVGVCVPHDDDCAAGLNFVKIKEIFILVGEFDVFAEESDIVLG